MIDITELIEELMNKHGNDLKRTAFVMLGDSYLAEDITQETFVSFYKNYQRFNGDASYKTYLYRILMNHIKMYWRKRIPKPHDLQTTALDFFTFEEMLVNTLYLHRAIHSLNKKQSEVITLYYYNQYGVEEIALILDISTSSVKMRLKRGRDALKKHLSGGLNT